MRDLTQGPIPGHLPTLICQTRPDWPAYASTTSRVLTFMLPALWISTLPGLQLDHVWYLSVASVWLQAALSIVLLTRLMRTRLVQVQQN